MTGLVDGELIVGVDFRPSDGSLYAVGNTSRLYRIQAETGVAVSGFTPAEEFIVDPDDRVRETRWMRARRTGTGVVSKL